MKISGSGSGQPTSGVGDASEVEGSGGKEFVGKLDKTEKADATTAPSAARSAEVPKSFVSDIGQALESGAITPQAAVDQVVGRVLDNQLGAGAPAGLRSKVESALREAIETDPVLSAKVRSLG
jgi:hypothetical protein